MHPESRPSFRTALQGLTTWTRLTLAGGVFALPGGLLAGAAHAQVQGVSYTLTPTLNLVRWDQDLGLRDATLYGGRFALNFGRTASLQSYYLRNSNVRTRLAGTSLDQQPFSPALADQAIDVRDYGADLVLNLARGPVVPFLRAGGGIMRFAPASGQPSEQIALKAGGGARFGLFDRVTAQVFAEDNMFRANRYRFAASPGTMDAVPADPGATDIRHNLYIGTGVNLSLGGYQGADETALDRAFRTRFQGGVSGMSIPIEPYIGELNFDDRVDLPDQRVAGVRSGLNFGNLLGLRGYYWRGIERDFGATTPLQSWGGEAQFNLGTGTGLLPFLVLGAGQLDFRDDFRDPAGLHRDDKVMLIGGGGGGFTLARRLRMNVAARDYIFSQGDPADVSTAEDLRHNWLFSGGLTFMLGGSTGGGRDIDALGRENGAPGDGRDSHDSRGSLAPRDSATVFSLAVAPDAPAGMTTPVRTAQSDRVVTLPVPLLGEIYIRYGDPGGVPIESRPPGGVFPGKGPGSSQFTGTGATADDDELRLLIRRAVREELGARAVGDTPARGASALSADERTELLERRLADVIDARINQRLAERLASLPQAPSTVQTVIMPPPTPSAPAAPLSTPAVPTPGMTGVPAAPLGDGASAGIRASWGWTYTGMNLDTPRQAILGARLDLGPVRRTSRTRLLPEIAIGMFNGSSYMLTGNLYRAFPALFGRGAITPYGMAGAGILRVNDGNVRAVPSASTTQAVINVSLGLTRQYGNLNGFAEYQGVDLWSYQRVMAGLTWGY